MTASSVRFRSTDPLVVITIVVGLSLIVAIVLFGFLDSTGIIENKYAKFGGSAAGFFATLILLQRWHDKLAAPAAATEEAQELLKSLQRTAGPPNFRIPEGFQAYMANEESLAFCYPQNWQQEAQRFDLIFVERREQMRLGDQFRGNLNVVVLPTTQRVITLDQLYEVAGWCEIDPADVEAQVGVKLSGATAHLPIALNQTLAVLGIDEPDFADRLYHLEALVRQHTPGVEDFATGVVYVDGVRSMSLSATVMADDQRLLQYQTVSYIPALDVSYIFTFTDDEGDRESIMRIAQEVLATARFWSPDSQS